MRICTKCDTPKELDCFGTYTDKRFGRVKVCSFTWCKTCMNKQCADWQKANPEKVLGGALKKFWPGSTWQQALNNFLSLLDKQNSVCAICKKPEVVIDARLGKPRRLAVDHCHTTGKVRGLLCTGCNHAVGKVKDNVQTAYALAAYLEHSERELTLIASVNV